MTRNGEASIKVEFLRERKVSVGEDTEKEKRKGGQNKKRGKPYYIDPSSMLCQFVIKGTFAVLLP